MNPSLAETIYVDFITSSPTTGAATDADSTPTCEVFEDATDTAILSPTVVKRTGKTGNYRVPVACTAANGFEAAKSYNVVVTATVGAVAAKAVVQTFQMRTNGPDDLATSILTRATPAQVATELANVGLTTTVTGRIDAAISTRSTYAGADTAGTTTLLSRVPTTVSSQASNDQIYAAIDTEVGAIKTNTDKLGTAMELDGAVYRFTTNALEQAPTGTGGGSITAGDITAIAQEILKIDWTTVSGEAAYSTLNALRMLRCNWTTTGGTLTVKKEDGSTTAFTKTLSTDPAAEPITGAS
jgi:hypothetical protein